MDESHKSSRTLNLSNTIKAVILLLERIMFEIASFRALSDDQIAGQSASWLFSQYDQVLRARYTQAIGIASSTELGVSRALVPLLSGKKKSKKMPKYPTFEETMKSAQDRAPAARAGGQDVFKTKFEAVNMVRVDTGDARQDAEDD